MDNLINQIKKARFIWICGNGGSAATAEHFTEDLFSKGIKAICLNSNISLITMIANDYGYRYIFSKQLEIFRTEEDLLITISCSGKSPNILEAVENNRDFLYQFETLKKGDKDYESLEDKHLKFCHEVIKRIL